MNYYHSAVERLSQVALNESFPDSGKTAGTAVGSAYTTSQKITHKAENTPPKSDSRKKVIGSNKLKERTESSLITLGADRIDLRSPDVGKIYVALDFPVKVALSFSYFEAPHQTVPKHKHWRLLKFDRAGTDPATFQKFEVVPSRSNGKDDRTWFTYDALISAPGKFAYVPEFLDNVEPIAFEVISKQGYQKRLLELLNKNLLGAKAKIEIIQKSTH